MKKKLIRDILEFRSWQSELGKKSCEYAQEAIIKMLPPSEYPVIISWTLNELIDFESQCFEPFSKLEYIYIYLGNFPVKNIKHGRYVYQVFQSDDVCDI